MEAAILSSESPNGLFNSLAGGGNVQSESGSALPFSQIFQSQQLSTATNATLNSQRVLAGQSLPSLQQLAMAASQNTGVSAAPWLTLHAQTGTEHDLLSTEELQVLEPPTTLDWVDPALTTVESRATLEQRPWDTQTFGLTADAQQGDQPSALPVTEFASTEAALFESSGGGGQTQTVQLNQPQTTSAVLESAELAGYSNSETTTKAPTEFTATDLSDDALANSSNTHSTPLQPLRVTGQTEANSAVIADEAEFVERTPPQLTGTSQNAEDPLRRNAELQGTAEGVGPSAKDVRQQEPTSRDRTASLAAESPATVEGERTLNAEVVTVAESVTDNQRIVLDNAEVPQRVGTATDSLSKDQKLPDSTAEVAQARVAAVANDKQRTAEVAAAQVAAINTGNAQNPGTATAVSATEALSTQVRSALQSPSKRVDSTDRVEPKVATDGSEGYHWLASDAETPAPEDSEASQINRPLDGGSYGVAGTAAPVTNVATRSEVAGESFAAVKQAVDESATSGAKSAELSETANLEIDTPVREAQWSQALSYRVQFMAQQGIQRAQIQLNPAELGPMEISVDVVDDVAQVQITAEHAATKEAVEQAVPRLREMMALSGFGETNVELNSSPEDAKASAGDAQLAHNAGDSADGEGGASSRDSAKQTLDAKPIETLAANESPTRTADGRMSFYV